MLHDAPLVECPDDARTVQGRLSQGHTFLAFRQGEGVAALQFDVSRKPFASLRLLAFSDLDRLEEQVEPLLSLAAGPARQAGAEVWSFVGPPGPVANALRAQQFRLTEEVLELEKRDMESPSPGNREVRVRPAREEDLLSLVGIDAASFDPPWQSDATFFRHHWAQADFFRVVEADGGIVGYLVATEHPEGLYVVRLAVPPAWQGQGIGIRLLNEALKYARERRKSPLLLNTQRSNHRAQRLYRWFNFQPTGRVLWALTRGI
ncbi:MAG: GNAT family N-acetyltransferase [Anaerolineae bacterium]